MRIAMLLHKSVEHDSRVRREARALVAAGHQVTVLHLPRVAGHCDGEAGGFEICSVTPPAWVRERLPTAAYRLVFLGSFVLALLRLRPDAVHAHDAAMLAPGWLGSWATGAKLVYDSHELATGVPYRERVWGWGIAALERLAVPRCDFVITVSDGIAERLTARYRLARPPVVVRNLPDPAETDEGFVAPDLRQELGMEAGAPLVLHLGAVAKDRGCESLVESMAEVPGHLLFLGADDSAYAEGLRRLAVAQGVEERVHLRPSVATAAIRAHTVQASVGVSLLEDTCENHRLALPNKVFEYLAAGLPVVVSDLPELRALARERGDAWAVDTARPAEVAAALVVAYEAPPAATSYPRWEEEAERLLSVYRPAPADGPT